MAKQSAGGTTNGTNGATAKTTKGGLVAVRPTLVGTTPILMQAMSDEKIIGIVSKREGEKVKKGMSHDEALAWIVEHMVKPNLTMQDGRYGLTTKCLTAALIEGGSHVALAGRTKFTSGKKSLVSVFLQVADPFLPFPEEGQEWV